MTDPLSLASTAVTLLKQTTEGLNALRERAQRSKDLDIKDQIASLYDNLLSLKEVISRLLDQNTELRQQIERQSSAPEKPKIKQVGDTNYYFIGDSDGPYCQPCYDGKGKLSRLSPPEDWNRGVRRECPLCHEFFYEKKMDLSSVRLGARRRPYTG